MRTLSRLLSILLLASLAAWAPGASAAVPPPPAEPTATGFGGAAATVDPYASQAAIDVLRAGGNAVDATIAASAVIGVVEPYSAGIGGGGFMVLKTRRGTVETIDGREEAPQAFTPTSFTESGTAIPFAEAVTSGLGVGVPGTVRTWELALRRYGTMSLSEVLQPAIRLAREGIVVDQTLADQTASNAERFAEFPSTAELFLPGGQPLQAGDVLVNEDLAETYEAIADEGADAFYSGPIAEDIARTVQDPPVREGSTRNVRPGLMTEADLARYRAIRRPPAVTAYRNHTVAGMAPPSSGGSTVGEALNIIEALSPTPLADAVELLHAYIEASRLAYADRGEYIGDPAFVDVPLRCLLSQTFANGRAALIGETALPSPQPAGRCWDGRPLEPAAREGMSTTNLTVADDRGTVVEYTFTIEQTGGSGIVVPGRGVLLNNELTDFNFTPGTANSPAAGKRPRSSMAPTIILRNGRPVLALGSPGGATIITTVLQTIVNYFERGMSLPEALAAPRISQRNTATTPAEPAFLGTPEAEALIARGHAFSSVAELGAATGIEFVRGGPMVAAAEPARRGGGSAMVVRETRNP